MIVPPLYPSIPVLASGNVFNIDWLRWFQSVYEAQGWSPQNLMFNDLPLQTVEIGATATHDGNIKLPSHDAASEVVNCYNFTLPNNWRNGSNLYPYIKWKVPDANSGNVVLKAGYSVARDDAVLGTETTESKTIAAPGTLGQITLTEFTAIDGSALLKGDSGGFSFARVGDALTDTYGSAILMVKCGVKAFFEGIGHEKAHP